MSKMHTDDSFMYEGLPIGDAMQKAWENQMLDDYETPVDMSSVETDPLVNRITHQRGPKVPSTESQEETLNYLVSVAEELGLYDDAPADELNGPMHRQVSGSHYNKYPIQPAEYCYKNGLNNLQSEAISYITRYGDKGGKVDLEKAIHTLEILIHMEYGSE